MGESVGSFVAAQKPMCHQGKMSGTCKWESASASSLQSFSFRAEWEIIPQDRNLGQSVSGMHINTCLVCGETMEMERQDWEDNLK